MKMDARVHDVTRNDEDRAALLVFFFDLALSLSVPPVPPHIFPKFCTKKQQEMTMNERRKTSGKRDLPTVPIKGNATWQDAASGSFHRATFHCVRERCITLGQHGRTKDPAMRELTVKMRKCNRHATSPKRRLSNDQNSAQCHDACGLN